MRYLNLIEPEKMPFEKNIARSLTGLFFSRLMKFIAKAAIPDAEEAIRTMRKIFSVSMVK
jgi:hypothetical protein